MSDTLLIEQEREFFTVKIRNERDVIYHTEVDAIEYERIAALEGENETLRHDLREARATIRQLREVVMEE